MHRCWRTDHLSPNDHKQVDTVTIVRTRHRKGRKSGFLWKNGLNLRRRIVVSDIYVKGYVVLFGLGSQEILKHSLVD